MDWPNRTQTMGRVLSPPPAASTWSVVLVAGMVGLAALALRVGLLGAQPEFDELYHLLAARGWLETGQFRILDGEYTRGAAYTRVVAWLMEATGQTNLEVARLVSLVPGVLLPVAAFLWTRAVAGWLAGLMVAAFMVAWPQGILEAQILRFYSAHVLLFFLGAISVYGAVASAGPRRWVLAALALAFFAMATALQMTTVIGLLGIALWVTVYVVLSLEVSLATRWRIAAALVGAGLVGLGVAQVTGLLERAWAIYRFTPDHSVEVADYVAFYHNSLRQDYETFWPIFPVAVLIGHFANPRLTWFCVSIFATAFVLHSFGAMKANRYLSYAMPFFFTVWGVAIAALVPPALSWLQARGLRGGALAAVLACIAGFAVLSNGLAITSAKRALGSGFSGRGDWSEVRNLVGDWTDAPFVATTRELHMAAFFGDYDADLRAWAGWEAEYRPDQLFDRDWRTGRMVVRAPEGWDRLLACQRDGLLVVALDWWRSEEGALLRDLAEAHGLTIDTRQERNVVVARWRDPQRIPAMCDGVPDSRAAG